MDRNLEKPRVSVIIPTFNRSRLLKEAIDSVLAQEFGGFELIVVDDGSTDGTPEVTGAYANAIRTIRQENRGVSAARNRGIAEAAGDLIAFLDSDDLWLPKKLTAQVAFFDADPEAEICQTEEIWIRNGRRLNPGKKHRKGSGMIFERSLRLCLVSPSAVMIRKSLFAETGVFDESLPACEDYDLWLRIGCRRPIHLIEAPLVIKRGGHPDQLSSAPGLDRFRIASLLNLIESGILSEDQRRAAESVLREKCAIYAEGCRKRGRPEEAEIILCAPRAVRPSLPPRIPPVAP